MAVAESKQSADRAFTASLIGMLRMVAETGNLLIVQVQYRTDAGALTTSPYASFVRQDEEHLMLYTGQADREMLAIRKGAITRITLIDPAEILRSLNGVRPFFGLSPTWPAAMSYPEPSCLQ